MIVVDVGCKTYDHADSIGKLIDRFDPDVLYGFDPSPVMEEGISLHRRTVVITRRAAAWTTCGTMKFRIDGTISRPHSNGEAIVPCFDLAEWILYLLPETEIVLKIDAEGSEYQLLERIAYLQADRRLSLLLVEWHGTDRDRRGWIEESLSCPIEEW